MKLDKSKQILEKLPAWILTVATVAAILWLTLAPRPLGDMETPWFPGADKVVHAVMFGFLMLVACVDRLRFGKWHSLSLSFILWTALAVTAFGISTEFMQGAMHIGRSFDPLDMVADATGVILVSIIFILISKRHGSASKK